MGHDRDEVWQELLRRADRAGCEALVLTTNTQIFGDRIGMRDRHAVARDEIVIRMDRLPTAVALPPGLNLVC